MVENTGSGSDAHVFEQTVRLKRKQRFFQKHPVCCFCGGDARAVTWDHVPPRACFPPGHHPEDFEFPACDACNQATRKLDHVFGCYSQLLDGDDANYDYDLLRKRLIGIRNNYPDLLPDMKLSANEKRRALKQMGMRKPPGVIYRDIPLVGVPLQVGEACLMVVRKLALAFNYKERGIILSRDHTITGHWHQIQNASAASLTHHFDALLPEYRQPSRSNIRNYGRRLSYKFAVKESEDFLVFAAQFGAGLILWGMTYSEKSKIAEAPIAPKWAVGEPW